MNLEKQFAYPREMLSGRYRVFISRAVAYMYSSIIGRDVISDASPWIKMLWFYFGPEYVHILYHVSTLFTNTTSKRVWDNKAPTYLPIKEARTRGAWRAVHRCGLLWNKVLGKLGQVASSFPESDERVMEGRLAGNIGVPTLFIQVLPFECWAHLGEFICLVMYISF